MQPASITRFNTHLIMIQRSIYLTGDFHGLIKKICFVQWLSIIQPIIIYFRVEYCQLLIAVGSIDKVLQLVVAVTEKWQRWAWLNIYNKRHPEFYSHNQTKIPPSPVVACWSVIHKTGSTVFLSDQDQATAKNKLQENLLECIYALLRQASRQLDRKLADCKCNTLYLYRAKH